jgi:hypothetical protein
MSRQMNKILLLSVILFGPLRCALGALVAEDYLSRLRDTASGNRSNLATLAQSADRAANEFLSDGTTCATALKA